jgi:hypothetical protein
VRRKRWTPDADDRQGLTEHLFYEVQMAFFLAAQLDAPTGSRLDVSLRNAQIEAFNLHLRQLTEFFWGEPGRERAERYAYAVDFYSDGEWERVRPDLPTILVRLRGSATSGRGSGRSTRSGTWCHRRSRWRP